MPTKTPRERFEEKYTYPYTLEEWKNELSGSRK